MLSQSSVRMRAKDNSAHKARECRVQAQRNQTGIALLSDSTAGGTLGALRPSIDALSSSMWPSGCNVNTAGGTISGCHFRMRSAQRRASTQRPTEFAGFKGFTRGSCPLAACLTSSRTFPSSAFASPVVLRGCRALVACFGVRQRCAHSDSVPIFRFPLQGVPVCQQPAKYHPERV